MGSSIAGLIDVLTSKMSYLNQKQGVLAENIANVNTPGYKQRDLKAFSFDQALRQADPAAMAVTNPKHIIPAGMAGVNAKTEIAKNNIVSPNGNSVDLENQMMDISKTSVDYQATTSIYKKMTNLIKTAARGSGGQ